MPRPKKVVVTQDNIEEVIAPAIEALENAPDNSEAAVISTAKTEFTVLNSSGGEVRTYSLADHGENAEALANQYAGKIGGSVV